ncbi:dihydrofolate reductase [Haloarculaceae archaeon H-GB2-1]|nr:dihydrofolate reductase [Haloarculaceae archaeon H-GB1-1]MEA5386143.1 dihydrofolate reductase [Haloarculaceae archaeon H-GB11]MEA5407649.1 dihydrofolate reductase [Haloarculaceae archaeon H-GB2-1]
MSDPDDLEIVLVVALTDEGVIGKDGDLPWYYPEDLQHFKETTMGHPVVMGRKTYESLPDDFRPLPGRTNVVLSTSNPDVPEEVAVATDLDEAWAIASDHDDEVHVIGGAVVFEQTLADADRLVITEVHEEYDGDTYFPEFDREQWREVSREDREELSFVEYVRE